MQTYLSVYLADLLCMSSWQTATKDCEVLQQRVTERWTRGREVIVRFFSQLLYLTEHVHQPAIDPASACHHAVTRELHQRQQMFKTSKNQSRRLEPAITLFLSWSMPKSEQRCSTNMSVSTKESWSRRSSTRSLAVSLPWRTLWYTTDYVSEYPTLEKYTKKKFCHKKTPSSIIWQSLCQQELRVLEHLLKCKRFVSYATNANLYQFLFFDTDSLWVNVFDSHRDKRLWIFTVLNIRISSENKEVRTLVYI